MRRWKKAQGQQGRKVIDINIAIVKDHKGRFILYHSNRVIDTMWVLYDSKTGTQHYLYGEDLRSAKIKASERIDNTLKKEV